MAANLAFALDQLCDAPTLLEQFENLEVLSICMGLVCRQSCWPTPAEIAAISGLDISRVLNVEERLGGTYEFALRARLVENRG